MVGRKPLKTDIMLYKALTFSNMCHTMAKTSKLLHHRSVTHRTAAESHQEVEGAEPLP
jgi:hypothetical protein